MYKSQSKLAYLSIIQSLINKLRYLEKIDSKMFGHDAFYAVRILCYSFYFLKTETYQPDHIKNNMFRLYRAGLENDIKPEFQKLNVQIRIPIAILDKIEKYVNELQKAQNQSDLISINEELIEQNYDSNLTKLENELYNLIAYFQETYRDYSRRPDLFLTVINSAVWDLSLLLQETNPATMMPEMLKLKEELQNIEATLNQAQQAADESNATIVEDQPEAGAN